MTLALTVIDGVSLIEDARVVIYDRNVFRIQATGLLVGL
jgi:hypothetical protein